MLSDPGNFMGIMQDWLKALYPINSIETQKQLWEDGLELWQGVLGQYGIGPKPARAKAKARLTAAQGPPLCRSASGASSRFFYAAPPDLPDAGRTGHGHGRSGRRARSGAKEQLEFAVRALVEALSPDNFPLLNPVVMETHDRDQGRQAWCAGCEHLINDLKRGQLTHTDPDAFRLGENIAATPGKVVHETPLYQLIQYSPTTENVLEVPLVIFPPWINRFYILDLTPKKSFIRWAVEQGISVFVVSWKSADETHGRDRVGRLHPRPDRRDRPRCARGWMCPRSTPSAIAWPAPRWPRRWRCWPAGARRTRSRAPPSSPRRSISRRRAISRTSSTTTSWRRSGSSRPQGYLDGRYLAATFNLLRGRDLIWNYVVNNYLLGEDYPAFDLLHWNGDVTNLPPVAQCLSARSLPRQQAGGARCAEADGTPIDLTRIETPATSRPGARITSRRPKACGASCGTFAGRWTFLLAGSGHIAGVVNPPSAGKYQYWTNSAAPALKAFVAGATEHPGSWWPHWLEWLHRQSDAALPAKASACPAARATR
jgi:polyhydroxyalkanoate synthase subunit PhaC